MAEAVYDPDKFYLVTRRRGAEWSAEQRAVHGQKIREASMRRNARLEAERAELEELRAMKAKMESKEAAE